MLDPQLLHSLLFLVEFLKPKIWRAFSQMLANQLLPTGEKPSPEDLQHYIKVKTFEVVLL